MTSADAEQPTSAPEQPTSASEQPTSASEQPTSAPEQSKKNPYISALAWMSITIGVLALVFVLSAAGVEAQAHALAEEPSDASVPTAQGALLYAWAGSCASIAFFTFIAWLVARAATWRPSD